VGDDGRPGKPIDTERYFVICPNVLGGCMGTTGPASTNPQTGKPWGLEFPGHHHPRHGARAGDAARPSRHRARSSPSSAARWAACRCWQWAGELSAARVLGAADRLLDAPLAQNIAFHEVGRQAVMADPEWRGGRYFSEGTNPAPRASRSRAWAHISPTCRTRRLHRKFGRKFQDRTNPTFLLRRRFRGRELSASPGHLVRRALRRELLSLSSRGRWTISILAADYNGVVANAFRGAHARFCVVSFTSDGCSRRRKSRAIVHALNASGARSRSPRSSPTRATKAFLLDEPELLAIVRGFLTAPPRRAA
jgi:homoserine O-acetyltransferase